MPRSVNSVASRARRKKVLKRVKGFWGIRKSTISTAKYALDRAYQHAYVGRKLKKRNYRSLWITRINAAVREEGMTYKSFIHKIQQANIGLNRKTLADLAGNHPETFREIVKQVA
ncbi:MAG: 50S ribosomal protein L20 [Bacteroidetes bacterium RIFCSPLOWO2_02_FULL_36_8]|nr:MAG: 50S ribosomal protein L20 [Bacteroidetes bacterium RIFCSPLOWO2_02_FULL_36_8]OFY69691.1 MAG: 50S ribosomal protein L20 [Bacteroidetes bacterium RIFCSPLOWO2_12_FULL_37_12]